VLLTPAYVGHARFDCLAGVWSSNDTV